MIMQLLINTLKIDHSITKDKETNPCEYVLYVYQKLSHYKQRNALSQQEHVECAVPPAQKRDVCERFVRRSHLGRVLKPTEDQSHAWSVFETLSAIWGLA